MTSTKLTLTRPGSLAWFFSGDLAIWVNAAAVSLSIIAVVGLIALLATRGLSHFWPGDIVSLNVVIDGQERVLLGESVEREQVSAQQLREAGFDVNNDQELLSRTLIKRGNRDFYSSDYVWVLDTLVLARSKPLHAGVIERLENGNLYGYLGEVRRDGKPIASSEDDVLERWQILRELVAEVELVRKQIYDIEHTKIGGINHQLERLRLRERSLQLAGELTSSAREQLALERSVLNDRYAGYRKQLTKLYRRIEGHSYSLELAGGEKVVQSVDQVLRAYTPNRLSSFQKLSLYWDKLKEFLTAEPRDSNTEGGVFPAIFGTVMMVLLMSVLVTPSGVVAAVYLHEYASQNTLTRIIRIAVNNLAGVPSIVYGVFGLGFFVYIIGGEIDQLFFAESLPSPTLGTPGLMWASFTLALLTLPVVIVATEEGLARIPHSLREGSFALGATRSETLWRVVLPMASPAMMTGLILAVARAAGEVAPLMLVGVVKLAPSLPVDANFPYFHLDQKFMHLGFHIYDVAFQSPSVEAARPLVYATGLLLVLIIALLNLTAVSLRNRLREQFKSMEN